jgi:hypothetical protein
MELESAILKWIFDQATPTGVALVWALVAEARVRRLLKSVLQDDERNSPNEKT